MEMEKDKNRTIWLDNVASEDWIDLNNYPGVFEKEKGEDESEEN